MRKINQWGLKEFVKIKVVEKNIELKEKSLKEKIRKQGAIKCIIKTLKYKIEYIIIYFINNIIICYGECYQRLRYL